MNSTRLFTLCPDHEPLWMGVHVQQIGDSWAEKHNGLVAELLLSYATAA